MPGKPHIRFHSHPKMQVNPDFYLPDYNLCLFWTAVSGTDAESASNGRQPTGLFEKIGSYQM